MDFITLFKTVIIAAYVVYAYFHFQGLVGLVSSNRISIGGLIKNAIYLLLIVLIVFFIVNNLN